MINQFLQTTSQPLFEASYKPANLAALDAYEIGQRIRQSRISKGLKQKELIEDQFSKSYISSIEAGRLIPSPRAFDFFAQRLNVSTAFLQWGSEIPPQEPPIDLTANRARLEPQFSPGVRKRLQWELVLTLAQVELEQNRFEVARAQLQEHGAPSPETSPTLAARYYFLSASIYLAGQDIKAALSEINRAQEIAVSIPERELLARLENLTADCFHQQNRHNEAVSHRRLALEALKQGEIKDPSFEAKVYHSLAEEMNLLNEPEQAIKLYQEAIAQSEQLNDRAKLAERYYELSLNYQKAGNSVYARFYAERSLTLYEELKNSRLVAQTESNFGLALIERRQFSEAAHYLQHALQLSLELHNFQAAALAATNLSLTYAQLENPTQEEAFALSAVEHAQKSEDAITLGQAMARLANMHASRNALSDADRCFAQAVSLLEPRNTNALLGNIYFEYGRTLMNLGRDREAAILFEKAYVLQSNYNPFPA